MRKAYAGADLVQAASDYSTKTPPLLAREFKHGEIDAAEVNFNKAKYLLLKGADGWKVYWEAIGYNQLSAKAVMAQFKKGEVTRWNFVALLDDYYNYEYRNARDTHYSIELTDRGSGEYFSGFIDKTSDDGKAMFDLLGDGKGHQVVVDIGYNDAARDPSIVNITSFVADNWMGDPEELKPLLGLN
ncbi:MAG: hypothetical protein DRI30_05865 [Chloroflexi bacterium]|nr:MAG: hypothetical protein DRI30_05865 [Chloroflexota bacterium]